MEGLGVNADGYFISNQAPLNVLVCANNIAGIRTNAANTIVFFITDELA
jgi:hypothetical protein